MKKVLIIGLATVAIAGGAYAASPKTEAARCVYNVETPYGTDAWLSLADARNAMVTMYGVNPDNTPYGYDITSKAGC